MNWTAYLLVLVVADNKSVLTVRLLSTDKRHDGHCRREIDCQQ